MDSITIRADGAMYDKMSIAALFYRLMQHNPRGLEIKAQSALAFSVVHQNFGLAGHRQAGPSHRCAYYRITLQPVEQHGLAYFIQALLAWAGGDEEFGKKLAECAEMTQSQFREDLFAVYSRDKWHNLDEVPSTARSVNFYRNSGNLLITTVDAVNMDMEGMTPIYAGFPSEILANEAGVSVGSVTVLFTHNIIGYFVYRFLVCRTLSSDPTYASMRFQVSFSSLMQMHSSTPGAKCITEAMRKQYCSIQLADVDPTTATGTYGFKPALGSDITIPYIAVFSKFSCPVWTANTFIEPPGLPLPPILLLGDGGAGTGFRAPPGLPEAAAAATADATAAGSFGRMDNLEAVIRDETPELERLALVLPKITAPGVPLPVLKDDTVRVYGEEELKNLWLRPDVSVDDKASIAAVDPEFVEDAPVVAEVVAKLWPFITSHVGKMFECDTVLAAARFLVANPLVKGKYKVDVNSNDRFVKPEEVKNARALTDFDEMYYNWVKSLKQIMASSRERAEITALNTAEKVARKIIFDMLCKDFKTNDRTKLGEYTKYLTERFEADPVAYMEIDGKKLQTFPELQYARESTGDMRREPGLKSIEATVLLFMIASPKYFNNMESLSKADLALLMKATVSTAKKKKEKATVDAPTRGRAVPKRDAGERPTKRR